MAKRTTANISLTPELQAFIDRRVASGRYQTASEVIREALRLLEDRERQPIRTVEDLKREIEIGVRQSLEGKMIDGPTAVNQVREKYFKRSSKSRRRAG